MSKLMCKSSSLHGSLVYCQIYGQVEQELEEERQRAEDAEKLAKEAIEAKVQELQQIEAARKKEVSDA